MYAIPSWPYPKLIISLEFSLFLGSCFFSILLFELIIAVRTGASLAITIPRWVANEERKTARAKIKRLNHHLHL